MTEKLRYKLKTHRTLEVGDVVYLYSWGKPYHFVITGEGELNPPPYCGGVIGFPVTYASNYRREHSFILHPDEYVGVLDPSQRDLVVKPKEQVDRELEFWLKDLED